MQLCLRLSQAELLQLPVILVDTSPRSELLIFSVILIWCVRTSNIAAFFPFPRIKLSCTGTASFDQCQIDRIWIMPVRSNVN
jgi:hypothetical protein